MYCEPYYGSSVVYGLFGGGGSGGSSSPERRIVVAQSGGDVTSINTAISLAAVLSPSLTNPVAILVYPGVYSTTPFVLPLGVHIIGFGNPQIESNAPADTGPFITQYAFSTIKSVIIAGQVAGIGILEEGTDGPIPTGRRYVEDVIIVNCLVGVRVHNDAIFNFTNLLLTKAFDPTHVMDDGLDIRDQAVVEGTSVAFEGRSGGRMSRGLIVEGDTAGVAECVISSILFDHVDELIDSNGENEVRLYNIHIDGGADEYLNIEGLNNDVLISSLFTDILADTWAIHIEPAATGMLRFSGSMFRRSKFFDESAGGVEINGTHLSDDPGDEGQVVLGELQVGYHDRPSEFVAGGGDSYSNLSAVLTNTSGEVGTWVDRTTITQSPESSTFDNLTAVGSALYIGNDIYFPSGIKYGMGDQAEAGITAVWEYWDGTVWVEFDIMASNADYPNQAYSNQAFVRSSQREHVQFDYDALEAAFQGGTWVKKTLNGIEKFWVRRRIVTSSAPTAARIEHIKIHPKGRTEINASGLIESFGQGQRLQKIADNLNSSDDLAGASPANENIGYAAGMESTPLDNEFADGALDGVLFPLVLPKGLNTARKLILELYWAETTGGSTGTVEFQILVKARSVGDSLLGVVSPDETDIATEVIAVNAVDVLRKTTIELSWAGYTTDQIVAVVMQRDARGSNLNDTYNGSIYLANFRLSGYFYTN